MKHSLLATLTAAAISFGPLTAASAQSNQQPSREERMQHWIADHELMMNARLGGMKEVLKLTPQQYPLWEVFENSVRDAEKARMETMQQMMQNREKFEKMSPADRMETMADHMAKGAAHLKAIAEAGKPFFASLDDSQKHDFEMLARTMMRSARSNSDNFVGDLGFSWEPEGWDN